MKFLKEIINCFGLNSASDNINTRQVFDLYFSKAGSVMRFCDIKQNEEIVQDWYFTFNLPISLILYLAALVVAMHFCISVEDIVSIL